MSLNAGHGAFVRAARRTACAVLTALTMLAAPRIAAAVPTPIHLWNFATGTARDQVGSLHGTLHGSAMIVGGRLMLDGSTAGGGSYMSTGADTRTMTSGTLIAWVSLSTLAQSGGSALTMVDDANHYDAIVFGERTDRQWMNGSDGYTRTLANNGGAPVSTLGDHMIAITYARTGTIRIYVDGSLYANAGTFAVTSFTNPHYLLGLRDETVNPSGALLRGSIAMAAVYSGRLSDADILTLYAQGDSLAVVAEPGSLSLLAAAGGLLLSGRLRRRGRSQGG